VQALGLFRRSDADAARAREGRISGDHIELLGALFQDRPGGLSAWRDRCRTTPNTFTE
jgi:hypothetical protein